MGSNLVGQKANMPVAALPLLAAVTRPDQTVTVFDKNVEDTDSERCAKAEAMARYHCRTLIDGVTRDGHLVNMF